MLGAKTRRVLEQSAFRRKLTPRTQKQSRTLLAINLKQRRRQDQKIKLPRNNTRYGANPIHYGGWN